MNFAFKFVQSILWLGIALSMVGELKSATLAVMGYAVKAKQEQIISLRDLNSHFWRKGHATSSQHKIF